MLELNVLGTVALLADGAPIGLSPLERGLLARVALTGTATVDQLGPWLWDDTPPASVPNRVQALVSGIRRRCADVGETVLTTQAGGYRLAAGVRVDLDVRDEQRRRAQQLAGDLRCLDSYEAALAGNSATVLQGVPSSAAVEMERDRLEQARLSLWEEYADAALALDRAGSVLAGLAALTSQHPLRETLVAQHVLALAATGQQALALQAYRDAHRRLRDELGVAPSARLQEAHAQVLAGGGTEPVAPSPAASPQNGGRTTAPVPRTLPRRTAGFVGRERELAVVADAADRATSAAVVVQVSGLTGMGRSALAVEAGQRLRDVLPDGALYLDAARDGRTVDVAATLGAFLRLLGTHPDAVPGTLGERAAAYRSLLDGRRVLVVLDDVDDAGDLSALLPAGAGALTLVTSRGPLPWLDPDVRVPVGALSDREALTLLAGVLGAERVAADPDGAAALVAAVGRMPLALRVVAGRARLRPDLDLATVTDRVVGNPAPGVDDARLTRLDAS